MSRVRCLRCRRPASVCYCAALPSIPTKTRVVILQHNRERDMAIGTARMASLCLPNSELHVGIRWGESAALAAAMSDPARPPVLLWPGEGARDVLADPPDGPVTLIVVDGTWSQAKVVVRDNPVLQALPRYAFAAPAPSQYRIRKEPRAEYVSTIEALMYVLGALEGKPAELAALLKPLHAMVDAQIAAQAAAPQRFTRQILKPRLPRPLPPALASRFGDLVCLIAEANAWPYAADTPKQPDEVVHVTAVRVATGEAISLIVAPREGRAPSTHFHTELSPETLLSGMSLAQAHAAFASFVRPTDIIAAWGGYMPNLWLSCGGTLPNGPEARLDLRAFLQTRLHVRVGSIEAFAARLPAPSSPIGPGRAGRRLGALAGIARWLSQIDPLANARTLAGMLTSTVAVRLPE